MKFMNKLLNIYRRFNMFQKVGFWGSVASIISLALVFISPSQPAESQSNNSGISIIGNVGDRNSLTVVQQPKYRETTVLNNQGSSTLVLKSFPQDKNFMKHSIDEKNQLGIAAVGTEVKVLEKRATNLAAMMAKKVKILSGDLEGETGWVSANAVREVKVPE